MYYVPTDWFLGDLAEGWPFAMLSTAGFLLTAAFALVAWIAYGEDRVSPLRVVVAMLLALASMGGAVAFAAIWIV